MLSICQICLSTDKTLQALKEPLSNWHDELCDFGIEDYALYCSECAYMLNKFHNFKEKCLQANKIFKKWKKQSPKVRTQLSQLKKEMPPSSLGIASINNHKYYFFQEQNTDGQNRSILYTQLTSPTNTIGTSGFVDTSVPKQTPNLGTFINIDISTNVDILPSNEEISRSNIDISKSNVDILTSDNASTSEVKFIKEISEPHFDSTNIETNRRCELKTILIEPYNENDFLKESEVKIEDDILNTEIVTEALQVKSDIDSDYYNSDHNITGDSDSEFDVEKLLSKALNSDNSSDDETLLKIRKRSLKTDLKRIKKKVKHVKGDLDSDLPLGKLKKIKDVKKDSCKVKKTKQVREIRGSLNKLNIESIQYNLLCKFGNKEVRDEDGNIIDKDCILDSLDKMHKYTLNKVARHCLGPKPFTREAIQVLSQIQKRYGNQFSSVFTTVHLTTDEEVLEEFNKRQLHETYLNSDNKCTLCFRGFKHKKLLEYHINEYHDPERPHACHICHLRFKSAPGLCKHKTAHRAVYKCKLCPLVTNYRTVVENHYNQHNGVKYNCEMCKAVLNSKTSLNAHINYIHPSRYICPICARTFVSEFGVAQHKIRKHPKQDICEGPDSKRCEACCVTFISDSVYQTHLTRSHAEKASNTCSFKKRKLSTKRQPPNFVCRVCKKVEHSIGRMTWHFRAEHPSENTDTVSMCSQGYKHLCHVCGKGYTSITDFNDHKHLHTGAKPYACDKCPKAFHRKTNLRSHLERHFPPTRECQHCGKKFLSAANLNNHIKMHIGIRRFTCELCAKSFLHRSALNAHVRGVHLRIRRPRKPNKMAE